MNGNRSYLLPQFSIDRGMLFGLLITGALLAFEAFNYSTTDYALRDLLGDLNFMGLPWAVVLAIAFCAIDFAGIARLFTPEIGAEPPREAWYLFAAWLLAATMNAVLTWWGVSLALLTHESLGGVVIARESMIRVVPIFIAVLVWLIRVLIIGTISVAGNRIFSTAADNNRPNRRPVMPAERPTNNRQPAPSRGYNPSPQASFSLRQSPTYRSFASTRTHPEPTYQPLDYDDDPSSRSTPTRRF